MTHPARNRGIGPSSEVTPMSDAAIWDVETRFWHEGEEFFDTWLAPTAIMVFPEPTGILDRSAILASIRDAPRWSEVTFANRRLARPTATVVTLAYRVEAHLGGDEDSYRALASSTYTANNGAWSIALHQQTPNS
jgi:hypothetical protein